MKFLINTIVFSFLYHQQVTTDALILPDGNKRTSITSATPEVNVDRRVAFTRVATTITAGVISGGAILASIPNVALAGAVSPTKGAEAFIGTFTDPINHPGGKRTIKLLDGQKLGDYQLAEVLGGGGRGEPENYVLPAAILGDRTIVIDFSPKGGPRDFVGILDKGDIKFLRDGNRWPRQ